MIDGNLIEASEQCLEKLRHELENNETCGNGDSEDLETNDDLLRVKKEFEGCYDNILKTNSKIIKTQLEENNKLSISNQKLTIENDELICSLKNYENNVKHLQEKMCILHNENVSINIFLYHNKYIGKISCLHFLSLGAQVISTYLMFAQYKTIYLI